MHKIVLVGLAGLVLTMVLPGLCGIRAAGGIPKDSSIGVPSNLLGSNCRWTTLVCNGSPTGRHETAFVEVGGRIYLIGGRESLQIDCFDPKALTWTKMKAKTPLIHHFQSVILDGKIYMLGAMTGEYPVETPLPRIQIYDPKKDQWTEGATIPEARRRGSAGTVLYNGKIYLAGGIINGHTSGTVAWFDEYDPATDTWRALQDAPRIRDHFFAIVVEDKLYCIGGRNTSFHQPDFGAFFGAVILDVDCYDFKKRVWTTLPPGANLPVGSAAAGTVYLGERILYFGGETASDALNTTRAFDPRTGTWTELAPLQQGRHGTQAVVFQNRIYVASGSPHRGGGHLESVEMYSCEKD